MEKTNQVFLSKIKERIKNGDFDKYLTLPFMTQQLLYSTLKAKIDRKIKTGGTPILNDAEVKDCLEETKHTAVTTFAIFLEKGFIVRTDEGFNVTPSGEIAIKTASKLV